MVGHPSLRMGKWAIDRHQYGRLQPNPPPQNWPQKFSVRLGRLCADGTWQLPNNLSPLVSFSTVLEEKMTNLFFRTKIQKCWFSLPKIPRVFLCFPATFPTSNMTYYQKSWDRNTRNIGEHRQQVGTSQETVKYIKIIDRSPERPIQKLPMKSPSHTQKGPYMNFELYILFEELNHQRLAMVYAQKEDLKNEGNTWGVLSSWLVILLLRMTHKSTSTFSVFQWLFKNVVVSPTGGPLH